VLHVLHTDNTRSIFVKFHYLFRPLAEVGVAIEQLINFRFILDFLFNFNFNNRIQINVCSTINGYNWRIGLCSIDIIFLLLFSIASTKVKTRYKYANHHYNTNDQGYNVVELVFKGRIFFIDNTFSNITI
jgi:hypothetical protein